MLPYFHASGHFLYAKSAHLYLQDMFQLEKIMDIFEYEQFTNQGVFTIRRSEKFLSGIWLDMTIEQVLMKAIKAIKSIGGLTHGRGLTESVITKWVLTMVLLVEVYNEMKSFCNISYATSEQHVDTRDTRVSRDALDLQKIIESFKKHDPFPVSENIMSISYRYRRCQY